MKKKILIYGCGLIGGSIAKSLVLQGFEVHSISKTPLEVGGITFHTSIDKIKNIHFEIVCVATPRGRNFEIYQAVFTDVAKLSCDFIVDCSSVQGQNEYLRGYFRGKFVPCHPIAGSEKVGFEHSDAKILEGKTCIVIYESAVGNSQNPPQKVLDFWQMCGMNTKIITTIQKHDFIYAMVSHLPQLISFFLPDAREPHTDFYRLKHSSREIWDEIFLHNRVNIVIALQIFHNILRDFKDTNMPMEKIISKMFLNATFENMEPFAGTGFATVTSCVDIPNIDGDEWNVVDDVIKNANAYLNTLLSNGNLSSITL